jgi:Zn-dependent protease
MRLITALKSRRLIHVAKIRGVSVYVHWTAILIGAAILVGAFQNPRLTFVVLISYMSVLLIHECGHLVAAQQRQYEVFSIELYPIFGVTRFETPQSRIDRCAIACGGVIAQAMIGIPLVIWVAVAGYSRFVEINAIIGILGVYSLCIAAFNLLPIAPLDGAIAWGLIPALWQSSKTRRNKNPRGPKRFR